jgi:hypothetical protein
MYHKRMAVIVDQLLPNIAIMGVIPFGTLSEIAADVCEEVSRCFNLTMFNDNKIAISGEVYNDSPWTIAASEALAQMKKGKCPVITAHTGTGKTKYLPMIFLRNTILPVKQVVVVMPRNIICEQMSNNSGALFKKKNVIGTSALMTVTGGFLAHCYANGNKWWDDESIFIFDEAHEESCEWKYLRRNFLDTHTCVALTATPLALPCNLMNKVVVNVDPKYTIEEVEFGGTIEEAMAHYVPLSKIAVIIEPSIRRCVNLVEKMKASGYPTAMVTSKQREIPPNVHIVATSVIEASITVPGADVIIDTGERLVNDGGTLKRVPNDIPGSIQRKGRTGRTNNGLYVTLTKPVNKAYEPVPEICMLLNEHPIVGKTSVVNPLDKNTKTENFCLNGDNYAHLACECTDPSLRASVSLLHKLRISLDHSSQLKVIYDKISEGRIVDEYDHLKAMSGVVDGIKMVRFGLCEAEYERLRPYYTINREKAGEIPAIKSWKVILKDDPHGKITRARTTSQTQGRREV